MRPHSYGPESKPVGPGLRPASYSPSFLNMVSEYHIPAIFTTGFPLKKPLGIEKNAHPSHPYSGKETLFGRYNTAIMLEKEDQVIINHEKWGRIRLCLRESPESKGMTRYNMKPRKDMSLRGLLPLSW